MEKVNKREKRTTIGVAMAICFLAAVTAGGALYANRAYAKETLQGITKVVKNVTEKDSEGNFKNPFVILEIVPDFIEKTFTVKDMDGSDVSVTLNVDIGSVGYYVKGQEPTTKNLKQALEKQDSDANYLYNNSELRKNIAAEIWRRDPDTGRFFLALENDSNAALVADSPAGYKELRLGEIMEYRHSFEGKTAEVYKEADEELMDKLVKDGTFIPLTRNFTGENGEAYIDTAKGKMQRVSVTSADDARGNYTLSYAPKLTAEGTLDVTADAAYQFVMNESGAAFGKSDDLQGEYDPYLVPAVGSEPATHRAVFQYIKNAPSGYVVKTSEAAKSGVAEGTPLYQYDMEQGVYVFRGYAVTEIALTGSGNTTDPGDPSGNGSATDPGNGSATDPGNGSATDPGNGSATDPGSGSGTGAGSGNTDPADPSSGGSTADPVDPSNGGGSASDPGSGSSGSGSSGSTDPGSNGSSAVPGADGSGMTPGNNGSTADPGADSEVGGLSGMAVTPGILPGTAVLGENRAAEPMGEEQNKTQPDADAVTPDAAIGADGDSETDGTSAPQDNKEEKPADGEMQPSGGNTENTTPAQGAASENSEQSGKTEDSASDQETSGQKNDTAEQTAAGEDAFEDMEEGESAADVYYILHFEYVPQAGGETLYQVSKYDTGAAFKEYAVNTSAIGAIVPNPNGTGTIRIADMSAVMDQVVYDYTPKQGSFNWTSEAWLPDAEKAPAPYYRIRGAQIYYSTGFMNRDFFKKYVFDREDKECDGLPIEVRTIPAALVTEEDVKGSGMLILQGGEPWYGIADGSPKKEYPTVKGGAGDISDEVFKTIKKRVEGGYPVVSDYGLFTGEGVDDSKSNVYNLTRTLILLEGGSPYKEGYDSDNNTCNNVIKSVYNVTYAPQMNAGFCNAWFNSKIWDETGFSEVMTDIRNENVYRVASGQSKLTNSVLSQATILRYIIAYAAEPEYKQKGSLHILELAPCASYTLRLKPSGDNNQYKSLYVIESTNEDGEIKDETFKIEFKSGDVTLTQMTTAEFIGHVDDINAYYDMIYIGSRTSAYKLGRDVVQMNHRMNDQGKLITDYNDSNMDGLIYTNIGDTYTTTNINFRNATGNEEMRFSGNDITEEKKKALQDFIHAGFPVVVSDELVNADKDHLRDDDRPTLSANSSTVDSSSWLYSFLSEAVEHENLFRLSEVNGSLLNMYLNVGRPAITLKPESKTEKATNATQQLFPDSNGNYRATFEFGVNTVGISSEDETYDFELYVDINADGKFSKTTEEITQIILEDENGNPIATDDQGRFQMRSGGSYVATYILSSSFRGVLPWKVRVIQNDESHLRRADAIGYYEVKDDEKPEDIKVLQICNTAWYIYGDKDHEKLLDRGIDEDANFKKIDEVLHSLGGTGNTWNMEKTKDDENTVFSSLINNKSAVPFDVSITSIPFDWITYEHRVYLGKKLGEKNVPVDVNKNNKYDPDEYLAFFRNFDMLVIGFGDAYSDPPDEMLEAISYYCEEGRSILFTHDCTSPYSFGDQHGSHFNRFLRGIFAMDRFNTTKYRQGTADETFSVERAYKPNDERRNTVDQVEGLTYPIMLRNKDGSQYNNLKGLPDKDTRPSYKPAHVDAADENYSYDWWSWSTFNVESVNKGQITVYPYKLEDKFPVARTHSQYWQLDFTRDEDHDGESDLVVWYTLSGAPLYDMSPRDVRNNYYIYNMGNITYSGVGHSSVMEAVQDDKTGKWSESVNEIKLFINTLIAAYQSGLHDPEVKIIENYNPQSRDVESIRLSYDEQLKAVMPDATKGIDINAGVLDATEDIYFVVNSTSLVRTDTMRTHTLSADIYIEVPTEDAGELLAFKGGNSYGKKVKIQSLCRQAPDGGEVYIQPDATGTYNLESGVVYKATVPVSGFTYTYETDKSTVFDEGTSQVEEDAVTARNAKKIFVVATESISNLRSGSKTETRSMDSLKAVRLRVFNMD